MDDVLLRREVVERPVVLEPDELRAANALLEMLLRIALDRDPLAHVVAPVLGVGLHGRRNVGRQRPRGGRPDHERLAVPPAQRKADEERGMLELLVVLLPGLLVLRE